MPGGTTTSIAELPDRIRDLFATERRAVMSTVAIDESAHSVPVVFALLDDEIVSPIDHKPKSGLVMERVKNLGRDDRITLLIDHWNEDWTRLAWVMVRGTGTVEAEPAPGDMRRLNERYDQYEPDERHDALIRIRPTRFSWWAWTDPRG